MHVRALPTSFGVLFVALALVVGVTPTPAGADEVTDAGLTWLEDQQQADGGFELAQYPPFETPEAIVAIAEAAQTTTTWDATAARSAVLAVDGGDGGATPADWADDFAEGLVIDDQAPGLVGGQAAKLIAFVAEPLGYDPGAFDPSEDGQPVDLEQLLALDQPLVEASPFQVPLFNSYLYATFADVLTGDPEGLLEERIATIRRAQQPDGAWNYAGNPTFGFGEVDTTGYAVAALIAAGALAGDATVENGLRYLAAQHQGSGAWQAFDADNVNSTATGLFGLLAAGWDQGERCWRQVNAPGSGSRPYEAPADYLPTQQVPEDAAEVADRGRFLSPNDGFGVNTFATSQALQGLLAAQTDTASWLPLERATLQDDPTFPDTVACGYYSQGVSWMTDVGITQGYGDGTFRPTAGMTRQAIAAQLYRFSGATFEGTQQSFVDVSPAHPFYDEIEWMAETGLSTGYADDTFRPANPVNRQQAAAFLHRIAGSPDVPEWAPSFPDVSPSHPFVDPIEWMATWRLTNPYPDGTFRPGTGLNRGQLSTFLYRLASTPAPWGDVQVPPTVLFVS